MGEISDSIKATRFEEFFRSKLTSMEHHCSQCRKIVQNIFAFCDTLGSAPYTGSKITRVERGRDGMFGVFTFLGKIVGYTLEHPKLLIPCGVYSCRREYSQKFERDLFEIKDVPDRTEIKIHVGNTLDDTTGCILLGKHLGVMDNKKAVMQSKKAVDDFMEMAKACDGFSVTVLEV